MIKKLFKFNYISLYVLLFGLGFFMISGNLVASVSPQFQLKIVTNCGNNIKEPSEQCDGTDLNGFSCADYNLNRGTLGCTSSCTFDISSCYSGSSAIPTTNVAFEGWAYPDSVVTLLKDGQIFTTTVANTDGDFLIDISDISGGNYSFIIYSEDSFGNRSAFTSISTSIMDGAYTRIGGIIIPPTVTVDKTEVKKGDNIIISGQSYPNITIQIEFAPGVVKEVQADTKGKYSHTFNSSALDSGDNFIKVKLITNDGLVHLGKVISLRVGSENILTNPELVIVKGDINNDGKVDLVDFSIIAYWYKKPLSEAIKKIEKELLNGDGKIDLVDFSIIAYYWTG